MCLGQVTPSSVAARGQVKTGGMLAQRLKPQALAVLLTGTRVEAGPRAPAGRSQGHAHASIEVMAAYFKVRRISEDQIADWARRMVLDEANARRVLPAWCEAQGSRSGAGSVRSCKDCGKRPPEPSTLARLPGDPETPCPAC